MDRAKEFLSTISHEIRTPLTSIKGFSKTILSSYNDLSDEQKKKFIQIIYEQSQRLINLVENALLAADFSEDYNNLVFKKTDINLILNKSIELVKINYKNINYSANLASNLYSSLDTDKLQQIFVNVLDNAFKYSAKELPVEIKTIFKNGKNIISIKNFGTEIPNELKDKIFEKFFRVQNYLTSKTQGSGLGLFIVKTLVEKMNGSISVNSKNSFVEFIIEFPVFEVESFTKETKIV